MSVGIERLPAPRPPDPPAPHRFPVVAIIAPVVASLAIWLLTGSAFALVFAALGPVTAIASVIDTRVSNRRSARRELTRFRTECEAVTTRIDNRHQQERAELAESAPRLAQLNAWRWSPRSTDAVPVALGSGAISSGTRIESPPQQQSGEIAERLAELALRAGTLAEAPVVVDARLGVGFVGPPRLAAACARAAGLAVAAVLSPAEYWCSLRGDDRWMPDLPHPAGPAPAGRASALVFGLSGETTTSVLIAHAASEHDLPAGCGIVLGLEGGSARIRRHPDREVRIALVPELVSRLEAGRLARQLEAAAARHGLGAATAALPGLLPLSSLLAEADAAVRDLACTPAVDDTGPVVIDLVAHGPHAVVGGTTGSGKSELLSSWVLAMAAGRPPTRVNFLLIDFKGGSAFAPLTTLPHVVGIVTDLDTAGAERALASLRAELRYRERFIVDAGARDIEGTEQLPRLVIVVDEFAAMVAEQPELHALFTDIAARGRALGVHLVLCTQRPTGVVRDSVLANAELRISLRVNNRGDSAAVVGSDAAAMLPPSARGRGVIALPGEQPRQVQFALAGPAEIEAVRQRWAGSPAVRRPWLEPLPPVVSADDLGAPGFGLLDVPEEQRRAIAVWDPPADGHVLVLGAAGSGKTTALAALAPGGHWLPPDPASAWDSIPADADGVIVLDDADSLFARFPVEYRSAFAEQLMLLLRDGPRRGIRFAVSAQRLTTELQPLVSLLPSRLYLGHASRQEVILAGGEATDHIPGLPAGGGSWRAHRVQVVRASPPPPDTRGPVVRQLQPGPLAIVSPSAALVGARLGQEVEHLAAVTDPAAVVGAGKSIVGDVDDWQSRWGALAAVRGRAQVLLHGCSTAEYRALTRSSRLPPLIENDSGLCWRLEPDGAVTRVRLPEHPSA